MMQTIDRNELKRMMDRQRDFSLVEVLDRGQYRKFHLPGAINVPLSEDFDEAIEQAVPDKNRTVVVYCSDKQCQASPTAARRMSELGYQNVYDYEAGKLDWKQAGLAIEGEGREVRQQARSA